MGDISFNTAVAASCFSGTVKGKIYIVTYLNTAWLCKKTLSYNINMFEFENISTYFKCNFKFCFYTSFFSFWLFSVSLLWNYSWQERCSKAQISRRWFYILVHSGQVKKKKKRNRCSLLPSKNNKVLGNFVPSKSDCVILQRFSCMLALTNISSKLP